MVRLFKCKVISGLLHSILSHSNSNGFYHKVYQDKYGWVNTIKWSERH